MKPGLRVRGGNACFSWEHQLRALLEQSSGLPNSILRNTICLSYRVSIVVKRHQDRSNSHKGKHLIGAGLQYRGLVHYHHGGAWQCAGRCGAGEKVEIPIAFRPQEVDYDTG